MLKAIVGALLLAGANAVGSGSDAGVTAASTDKAPRPEVRALVERLQAFYEKTDDFETEFRQEYRYKSFSRTQISTGKILFKKPALMRWDYEKPGKKSIVLTGEKVFLYDPDAMTLTKASMSTDQLSAAVTFLLGKGRLLDEFFIESVPCAACKGALLELTPRHPDTRFRTIRFEVDRTTAQVLRSVVFDPSGDENEIQFLKLTRNLGIARDRFVLNPPPNTEIRDYTTQAPKATP